MIGRAVPLAPAAVLVIAALAGCAAPAAPADQAPSDFIDVPGIGSTRVDVPRPTGFGSATCDADPLPPASNDSVEVRVAALRDLGLFADRSSTDDAALATEVTAGISDQWGDAIGPADPLLDLAVAEQDTQRVWWQDLEADVVDGNDVYVETLQGWAAISEGAFKPSGIQERWVSREGPVTVSFSMDGMSREVQAHYLDDWIDPGILGPINDLIAPSGRRFQIYKSFDQTAFVMALTDPERQGLEARGWCFE
jgi:hypothetical protein